MFGGLSTLPLCSMCGICIHMKKNKLTSTVDKYAVHSVFGLDNSCNPSRLRKKNPAKTQPIMFVHHNPRISAQPPPKKKTFFLGFKVILEGTPKKNAKQKQHNDNDSPSLDKFRLLVFGSRFPYLNKTHLIYEGSLAGFIVISHLICPD